MALPALIGERLRSIADRKSFLRLLSSRRFLELPGHVWTAPLVKGFFEALRTSRVRSCLRPVGAGRITPLALMIRPLELFAPISRSRLYRRRRDIGLPSHSVGSDLKAI